MKNKFEQKILDISNKRVYELYEGKLSNTTREVHYKKGLEDGARFAHQLIENEVLIPLEFFGCMTGDCPHEKQTECDSAVFNNVQEVFQNWRKTNEK